MESYIGSRTTLVKVVVVSSSSSSSVTVPGTLSALAIIPRHFSLTESFVGGAG